ncbi:MAG: TlpA family protein disulfide reductase [Acidobacteria bacterium]|nr:TlpA family protein disulfide reductase [Acidobacteriota bacterium]
MVAVGSKAPAFRLGTFSLENLAAPVLLAFFKISCPTCQLTFPFLQRLVDRGGPRIVGVSQDGAESTAEFNSAFGVRFETVEDPKSGRYAVSNLYGLEYVPALVLVETDGRISWTNEGFGKADLEALAARWGVTLFDSTDRVPVYKPG